MVRNIRLISGLVLFSYILSHFTNHALGLVSLATMERFLLLVYPFWANPLVTTVLYGSVLVHVGLALRALYRRRTLRLPLDAALQYVLGFSIPLLAFDHVVGTRVADSLYGADFGYYTHVLTALWYFEPWRMPLQLTLLVIAWTHACIGLRYRLRLEPWYDRAQPFLFAAALLFPTLAILGFAEGGREVLYLLQHDPGLADRVAAGRAAPEARATLEVWLWALRGGFIGSVALVLGLRLARRWRQRRHGLSRITYPDGRSIDVVRGTTVLEASRLLGVPHASVCGGKGRCSTCRVRVRAAAGATPPPLADEAAVLRRIAAAPNVRLACQLRPRGAIEVTPLLPPFVHARGGLQRPGYLQGSEKEIAILFVDLRAFTQIAERKLPYDVVFLLNRYFGAMGEAVEAAGGRVDKFIGDGVMALFGIEDGPVKGCKAALDAAGRMSRNLEELNHLMAHDLDAPLRIGIGIHAGPAIVGEMGWGRTVSLTAIGDAVNTASRLEALTKTYAVELVVSEDVVGLAGLDFSVFDRHEIEVRGRSAPLAVRTVPRARDLGLASALAPPSIAGEVIPI